jgi:flavin-dependent dehydrogenase
VALGLSLATLFQEMKDASIYDVAVTGGGLAGLTLSIQLARQGHSVLLFEKERYPFHRVCGEYISLESAPYLKDCGIDIHALGLPIITRLEVSAPDGSLLQQQLPLGGFGISRYGIDAMLAEEARRAGVQILEQDKISDLRYHDGIMEITARSGHYRAGVAVGSFGKRSNLDIKWSRPFVRGNRSKLSNYVGIKYHIRYPHPRDTIVLHNFRDGYCGMSAIEDGRSCLCYLTTAANLERCGHSIPRMEKEVLSLNPHLAKIFSEAEFLFPEPLAISQVSFEKKSLVEDHVLLTGDAAGMITPLCGNGMSMAMHGGKIAATLIHEFLEERISREDLEAEYTRQWQRRFSARLRAGRMIQSAFGKPTLTNLFVRSMRALPGTTRWLIRQTHGEAY